MTVDKRLIVLGLDPGESFGVAMLDSWCPTADAPRRLDAWQGDPDDAFNLITIWAKNCKVHADRLDIRCATERYTQLGGPHRTAQTNTPELIGRVRQWCIEMDIPLQMQAPSDVKAFANNNILKKYGLYTLPFEVCRRDADDANDAMRHAFYLFGTTKPSLYDRIHKRING